MSRFLFVVPPLVGHVNPLVGVAAGLAARGHATAWAGVPELVTGLAGPQTEVFSCPSPDALGGAQVLSRPRNLRGAAALKFLWGEFFAPLAEAMAPGVADAVARFRPDVLVVDQQTVAGALVAERLGLPWATSSTTSAELTGSVDAAPLVSAWIRGLLDELRLRIGDPAGTGDPRFSPDLVLAFSTPELAGPVTVPAEAIRFVGPSIAPRPAAPPFPWEWLDPGRAAVLVTLGTANPDAGAAFLARCEAALRERAGRLQAVVADPGGLLGDRGRDPDVLVRPSVPQLDLLAHLDAVVCHAGHNTVCEALWHGVPLVVAPIRDDQPVVAGQVAAAGAGVRVRFGRATRDRLGEAVDAVLGNPAYRAAAQRIGAAFRAAGGARAAAGHLERFAAQRHPTHRRNR